MMSVFGAGDGDGRDRLQRHLALGRCQHVVSDESFVAS